MSEQLITVGEATQALGVTSELPANKCLTKSEFDELVAQTPELAPNGVYIMHKDGFLVTKENWTYPNEEASGVAVKTDKCAFVIAKEEQSSIQWGENDTLINGCTTLMSSAVSDYNGKQNTDFIVNHLGIRETYAARYCKEYTFPHGAQGYLPALGELNEAYQNKTEIDACMSLIEGKSLYDSSLINNRKWSSTQYNNILAWIFVWNGDGGTIVSYNKSIRNSEVQARPFAAFK